MGRCVLKHGERERRGGRGGTKGAAGDHGHVPPAAPLALRGRAPSAPSLDGPETYCSDLEVEGNKEWDFQG